MVDAEKNYFDGAKTYKVTLPKGIPEENFWSFTLYDNQTRSMLDTPQRYPRAGSQSYPVACRRAECRRLDHGLLRPAATRGREARQLDPDRCRARASFPILRLYSPLEPFFAKTWRPSEVERVN